MRIWNRLKSRKGLTGSDVAAAITVIVLTVGIVTAIYVNTINKSKDNLRSANATRIATSIMENIQKKPYEYLTETFKLGNSTEASGGSKIFDTKVPNGFKAKVTVSTVETGKPDIARNVVINVTYKTSTTYKTISISSVKERELMDMTNNPDISLIPGYNPSSSDSYYYLVKKVGTDYKVTTQSDIEWYNYEKGQYALICKTNTSNAKVNDTVTGTIYAWIPRYVAGSGTAGISNVQFLYGTSGYKITFNSYGDLFSYGVKYKDNNIEKGLIGFDSGKTYTAFAENDGLSGVWYEIGGENSNKMGASEKTVKEIAINFRDKVNYSGPNITIAD